MRDRTALVLELINQPKLAPALLHELTEHGWYCEKHLAVIGKAHVLAVLKQFELGQLSACDVAAWANSVGGRTDIGFEFGADGVVEESLYWLAHPEVNGPLDAQLCQRIVVLYERRQSKRQPDPQHH
jgi:hypothetical protein